MTDTPRYPQDSPKTPRRHPPRQYVAQKTRLIGFFYDRVFFMTNVSPYDLLLTFKTRIVNNIDLLALYYRAYSGMVKIHRYGLVWLNVLTNKGR